MLSPYQTQKKYQFLISDLQSLKMLYKINLWLQDLAFYSW